MDSDQRKTLVLNAGSSNHDIANAVRQVNRDRRARRRSIHNHLSKPFYAFDVVKESATRKFKRLVMGQKKDSVLYDEYTQMQKHKESRRRELATMAIVEEEAAVAGEPSNSVELSSSGNEEDDNGAEVVVDAADLNTGLLLLELTSPSSEQNNSVTFT